MGEGSPTLSDLLLLMLQDLVEDTHCAALFFPAQKA